MSQISTTFEVYPTASEIPSVVELLKAANQKLTRFLQSFELQVMPVIHARVGENVISPCDPSTQRLQWNENYAWFFIEPSDGGGTDACCHKVDEFTLEIWDEYGDDDEAYLEVSKSLSVGHYWSFRRSAGQPAIINLAYGLLASALAELTRGYLFSDDGAWHGGPIRPKDFDSQYFVPGLAYSFADASWYERCLESIVRQYRGKTFELQYQLFEWNELSWERRLTYYPSGRLLREGPDKTDRYFIMWSMYDKLPYLFIDHTLVAASEEAVIKLLKLLDVKESFNFSNRLVEDVLKIYHQIDLERRDTSFWVNPLFIKNGEELRRELE